ncbi:MAG: glycosyltransferase family 1 protein, partial [Bacteroidia bacterium]|nr:glycosyltransferase family 1 protein [Bacteroidia bacterium]
CREAVIEGKNGFLIEPNNLEALIKSMEFFIANPDKIREMGINSRKYAEERFDVNIINNDLINLIRTELKV